MLNSYVHLFEYKRGIKFTLSVSQSYLYHLKVLQGLTNRSLDNIILNKIDDVKLSNRHIRNYSLEPKLHTTLRNLYSFTDEHPDN